MKKIFLILFITFIYSFNQEDIKKELPIGLNYITHEEINDTLFIHIEKSDKNQFATKIYTKDKSLKEVIDSLISRMNKSK